ncbi:conserved hypothetical protein [Segniliparus rotundus DSM 44985]|uniref:Uncharacterized protein n=1 Tax=Segniliparus rotundus (strain ATCC BAA-972 / CDC 1076 / CIP 108378 / DSM 44985 / JCM 13578) TaxID=640132 RepID=D6ZCV0_SEGRD|nr:hypothetical protein [Segniliparus rotundus]ADG99137.1 conserved hypothetical protein [Segniliparus rotundus DSM 44985]
MAGFLGLGNKRVAGLCLSAGVLLASCTQVVAGKGSVDQPALTSYLSSSSSSSVSSASASSSRAAAARQVVCSQHILGYIGVIAAWNDFVDALNAGQPGQDQAKALQKELKDAESQMRSADADPDSDIGSAVGEYVDALDGLSQILSGRATPDQMNGAKEKINTAEDKLSRICLG